MSTREKIGALIVTEESTTEIEGAKRKLADALWETCLTDLETGQLSSGDVASVLVEVASMAEVAATPEWLAWPEERVAASEPQRDAERAGASEQAKVYTEVYARQHAVGNDVLLRAVYESHLAFLIRQELAVIEVEGATDMDDTMTHSEMCRAIESILRCFDRDDLPVNRFDRPMGKRVRVHITYRQARHLRDLLEKATTSPEIEYTPLY